MPEVQTEIRSWQLAPWEARAGTPLLPTAAEQCLSQRAAGSPSPAVSQAHAAAFSLQHSDVVLGLVEFFVSFQSMEMSVRFRESSGVGDVSWDSAPGGF